MALHTPLQIFPADPALLPQTSCFGAAVLAAFAAAAAVYVPPVAAAALAGVHADDAPADFEWQISVKRDCSQQLPDQTQTA